MECRRLYGMNMSMIDTAGQQRTWSTFESLIRNCWWNFDCRYARSRVFHSKSYDFYAVVIRQIAAEYIRCAKKKKKKWRMLGAGARILTILIGELPWEIIPPYSARQILGYVLLWVRYLFNDFSCTACTNKMAIMQSPATNILRSMDLYKLVGINELPVWWDSYWVFGGSKIWISATKFG